MNRRTVFLRVVYCLLYFSISKLMMLLQPF